MKKNENSIGLLIQIVLAISLLNFIILYLYEHAFLPSIQITTSLFMFTAAYNNQKIYKRKYISIAYIICGLLILGVLFFG